MHKIDRYLKMSVEKRSSDLHFSSGEPVRMRIDGDLVVVEETISETMELQEMLLEIMSDVEKQRFQTAKNLDKSYSLEGTGNFRINVFMTRRGIAAVLRTIPFKIPSFADLGLPEVVGALTELGKGLVLVTGPTGSGKSTTLAAMINHINVNSPYHILTAEDPIEFVHHSRKSLINQREIGSSCPTFTDALKYALREDPDVILVGEMRDLETIGLALTAAETGHLVFGTLHTRGAGASVDRIIDSFSSDQQAMIRTMLSESLAAVISQSLLKRADGTGRVAAYEILIVNHAVSNLIREGKTFQISSIMQTSKKEGMVLMDQYIIDLVNKGTVTALEGSLYMENPAALGSRLPAKPTANTTVSTAAPTTFGTKPSETTAPRPILKPPSMSMPIPVSKPMPKAASINMRPPIPAPVLKPLSTPTVKEVANFKSEITNSESLLEVDDLDNDETLLFDRAIQEEDSQLSSIVEIEPAKTDSAPIMQSIPKKPLPTLPSLGAAKLPSPPPFGVKKKVG